MSNIAQNPSVAQENQRARTFAATEIVLNNNAVTICAGQVMASSYEIAQTFGKLHKDVLKRIDALDCSVEFRERNFALSEQTLKNGNITKQIPYYRMTFDGFVFLVGAFTGKKAAQFKEAYIARFNVMRDSLSQRNAPAPLPAPTVDEHTLRAEMRLARVLFTVDGYGRPHATTLADDACVVRATELPALLGDAGFMTVQQIETVAVAALQRLRQAGGNRAVQQSLGAVDPNYLLVLESELVLSLYGSRAIYQGVKHA